MREVKAPAGETRAPPAASGKAMFHSDRVRSDREVPLGGLVGVGFNSLSTTKPSISHRDEVITNPRRIVLQRAGSGSQPKERSNGSPGAGSAFSSLRHALAASASPHASPGGSPAVSVKKSNNVDNAERSKDNLTSTTPKSSKGVAAEAFKSEGRSGSSDSELLMQTLSSTGGVRLRAAMGKEKEQAAARERPSSGSSRSNAPSSRESSGRPRRTSSSSSSSSPEQEGVEEQAAAAKEEEQAAEGAGEKEAEGSVQGLGSRATTSASLVSSTGSRTSRTGKEKVAKKFCVFLGHCNNTSVLVMRLVMERMGWKEVDKEEAARFVWLDPSHAVRMELVERVCRAQRINFFPGMRYLCNKAPLYRILNRCKRATSPEEFPFFPSTWTLPEDFASLEEELRQKKPKTFIVKPDGGAQGTGIFLIRSGPAAELKVSASDRCIVQRYVHKPLLLGGYKFDLRLYVLVTSVDPLRCYLHRDGLARFCTAPYSVPNSKNLEEAYMHLTNYSLNKHNAEAFVSGDTENASKRSISHVWEQMAAEGLPTGPLWDQLKQLCLRTLQAMVPKLWMAYHAHVTNGDGPSMCFQILGFDVIIDHQLRPWLLETNNGPSLNLDEEADRAVKEQLVEETLNMVKTLYKQPYKAAAAGSAVTEEEVWGLRERRWEAHVKAGAWERKNLHQLEPLCDAAPSPADMLLFPLLRPELAGAFELAARAGERGREGLKGLTAPRFAAALKQLRILDNRRVVRADVDLVFIDALKDQDREKGMSYDLFGIALASLAKRLYPGIAKPGEAIATMLQDFAASNPAPLNPAPTSSAASAGTGSGGGAGGGTPRKAASTLSSAATATAGTAAPAKAPPEAALGT